MAARKKLSTESREFITDSVLLSVFLESANILGGWYFGFHTDHYWPWVVGPGYTAFRRLTRGKASQAAMAMSLLVPVPGGDSNSYILKYKDRIAEEPDYIFRGRGLPVPIPESKLSRFIKLAWRRQMNAIHGSQVQMMWDNPSSQAKLRRLTANQVLSARYFLKIVEPRFTEAEYLACIRILVLSNVLDSRKQGRAGLLMYEPGRSMELALSYWLPSPKPSWGITNLFRFSLAS